MRLLIQKKQQQQQRDNFFVTQKTCGQVTNSPQIRPVAGPNLHLFLLYGVCTRLACRRIKFPMSAVYKRPKGEDVPHLH